MTLFNSLGMRLDIPRRTRPFLGGIPDEKTLAISARGGELFSFRQVRHLNDRKKQFGVILLLPLVRNGYARLPLFSGKEMNMATRRPS
jgi:hypothetical protein